MSAASKATEDAAEHSVGCEVSEATGGVAEASKASKATCSNI